LQSQPNHIELVGEKNTIRSILQPIASEYCIPMSSARGYMSLPPRADIAERYHKSGKEKLVLLIASDFDPDGEEIAHSLVRSMRDDFGIRNIAATKVALNAEQVKQYNLPPNTQAKKSSSNYKKFVAKYGMGAYELEALEPAELQRIVREGIRSVLDIDAYNAELEAEKQDWVYLEARRRRVLEVLGTLDDDSE
jgi:hypothetical protein